MNFSITHFGGKPNSDALQTQALQDAIDSCYLAGGGEVSIPAGDYRIGSIRLRSGVTLHLLEDAHLFASRDLADYKALTGREALDPIPEDFMPEVHRDSAKLRRWMNPLILLYKVRNSGIIGEKGSLICGSNVYNPDGEEKYRGPHCIAVLHGQNLVFRGYTVTDSSNWAHSMWDVQDVLCEKVEIYGGHDGFDFFRGDRITARDCKIHTGDDCFAGFGNKDVLIEDCDLNTSCSVFRFSGCDVTVRRCKAYAPGDYIQRVTLTKEELEAGKNPLPEERSKHRMTTFAFYTYYADMRLDIRYAPSNILFEDCEMRGSECLIHFNYSGNEQWEINRPLEEITFRRMKAEGLAAPSVFYGDAERPARITLEDVSLFYREGKENQPLFLSANCKGMKLKNVETNATAPSAVHLWGNTSCPLSLSGGNLAERFTKFFEKQTSPFEMQPI